MCVCVSLHDYLNDPAGQPCHLVLNADFSFDSRCFLLRLHWRRRRSAHTLSGALRLDARGDVRNWWWWWRLCDYDIEVVVLYWRKTVSFTEKHTWLNFLIQKPFFHGKKYIYIYIIFSTFLFTFLKFNEGCLGYLCKNNTIIYRLRLNTTMQITTTLLNNFSY